MKTWLKISLTGLLALACVSSSPSEERKPDIVSQRAKIEDYYKWDGEKWVWSEDKTKEKKEKKEKKVEKRKVEKKKPKTPQVILGIPTIRWLPE